MAKYKMQATESYEQIVPASVMEYRNLLTGEIVDTQPVPEIKLTTIKGQLYTARNKADRDKLLKTGKWVEIK